MSVIRFPGLPESGHPQYLWNEQEYIIRELFKNRIGLGVWEEGGDVMVSSRAADSLNVVAHGAADIICAEFLEGFDSDVTGTGWVYIRLDGSGVYFSRDRPRYSQYLHGWYHPDNFPYGDRAVVFIDAELPQGRRAIVMDSSNSMFEYDTRNPDTGGDLVWEIDAPSDHGWQSMLLTPGNYRFELRGGNGGRGGNVGQDSAAVENPALGGSGGQGQVFVWKTRITRLVAFLGLLGGDGEQGQDGTTDTSWSAILPFRTFVVGGGGGSSGGDTRLRMDDTDTGTPLMLNALGGAGGGGAIALNPSGTTWANGAGGGGAGNPAGAEDGAVAFPGVSPAVVGGRAGTITNGGEGGSGLRNNNNWAGDSGQRGDNGQNIDAATRRNGGSSRSMQVAPGGTVVPFVVPGAAGGSRINGTSGYFRCYRTRDGRSW